MIAAPEPRWHGSADAARWTPPPPTPQQTLGAAVMQLQTDPDEQACPELAAAIVEWLTSLRFSIPPGQQPDVRPGGEWDHALRVAATVLR